MWQAGYCRFEFTICIPVMLNSSRKRQDSVLRPIDFVYHDIGVNRQLRSKDDDIIKNPNQVLYRDQINKTALAIRDLIEGDALKSTILPICLTRNAVLTGKE